MGYIVEQYRNGMIDKEQVLERLYRLEKDICELIDDFESYDESEIQERRNYRMSRRMNRRGRYDY